MGPVINLNDDAGHEIISDLLGGGISRKKAEEKLFSTYSYFIREGMHKYSLSEDESFDAYSDSVLAAIEKIINHSFEGRASLKTYLFQIFQHKCVDLLRKKTTNKSSVHRTQPISDLLYSLSDNAKLAIQQITERSDREILDQKLKETGENCMKLLLSWADGYPDKEIAALLEYKNADVVKTSRLRCLEKLRQLYKQNQNKE
ncbi:MAG: sigma-70 family RNA polymerase sigma factor [Chitinophagaceae bacterium]|nr:sigma-70 family RNA polymerase sigma factor [Chitinophagaceae bacterium]